MIVGSSLTLRPITAGDSGEMVSPFTLNADRPCLVGRSSDADWMIPDASVSRRHASITKTAGSWIVTDLSSRHGTSLNNCRIEPGSAITLHHGDVLAFGSWQCRVISDSAPAGMTTSFTPTPQGNVTAIAPERLGGVAQRGLEILMDLTGALNTSTSRHSVAAAAVEAIRKATGCRRVVVVEPATEMELTIIASASGDSPNVSRSLIEQATRLGMVEMIVGDGAAAQSQSILDLRIRSAICVPIRIDGLPSAFITVDTRDTEGVVPRDAAAFCQSVAHLVSLAFVRVAATDMAERHRQLHADLDAARRAQELLSPPRRGRIGQVSYQFESIPGRIVAGDLFDIFPLGEHKTAFVLGDVCGKGVGAAVLMSACQSLLRTHLLSGIDLAAALNAMNADLHRRTEQSKFITLVAGVIHSDEGFAELVDAGHGLCVVCTPEEAPKRLDASTGLPIGVVADASYEVLRLAIPAGSRLILFSDGAVEQTNSSGHQFGMDRVLQTVSDAWTDRRYVDRLVEVVKQHAGGPLADDLTVACLFTDSP